MDYIRNNDKIFTSYIDDVGWRRHFEEAILDLEEDGREQMRNAATYQIEAFYTSVVYVFQQLLNDCCPVSKSYN